MVCINDCEHRVAVYGFASSSTARRVSLLRRISGHFQPSRRVSPRQKRRPWLRSLLLPVAAQVEQRELPGYFSWLTYNGGDRELQYAKVLCNLCNFSHPIFRYSNPIPSTASTILRVGQRYCHTSDLPPALRTSDW